MRDIRPLRNEADYELALAEIARHFDSPPVVGTPQADRFDFLAAVIDAYELKYWRSEPADPVEASDR